MRSLSMPTGNYVRTLEYTFKKLHLSFKNTLRSFLWHIKYFIYICELKNTMDTFAIVFYLRLALYSKHSANEVHLNEIWEIPRRCSFIIISKAHPNAYQRPWINQSELSLYNPQPSSLNLVLFSPLFNIYFLFAENVRIFADIDLCNFSWLSAISH